MYFNRNFDIPCANVFFIVNVPTAIDFFTSGTANGSGIYVHKNTTKLKNVFRFPKMTDLPEHQADLMDLADENGRLLQIFAQINGFQPLIYCSLTRRLRDLGFLKVNYLYL